MKCKISAKALKSLKNSVAALQKLGVKTKDDQLRCMFTTKDDSLTVESAHMGAFLTKKMDCTTLRSGQFGINLKNLKIPRLSGEVTIDCKDGVVIFGTKKTQFKLATDQEAEAAINGARHDNSGIARAQIKTSLLVDATRTVALQPGLKEEDLAVQFRFRKSGNVGKMEVVGSDYFSYGRYLKANGDIKVKGNKPFGFVISSSAISTILEEAEGEVITVGTNSIEATAAIFKSHDTEILFPTMGKKLLDCSRVVKDTKTGKFGGSFRCHKKKLADAVSTVTAVLGSKDDPKIYITLEKDKITVRALSISGQIGRDRIDTDPPKLGKEKKHTMSVNEKYLTDTIRRAPDVLPIRVESWNEKHLLVEAEKVEDGIVQFFMSQTIPNKDLEDPD